MSRCRIASVPSLWATEAEHAHAGAIACTTAAVLLPQDLTVCVFGTTVDHKYLWLCFALALWGLGQGAGPVVEALLADSTRTGTFSKLMCLID